MKQMRFKTSLKCGGCVQNIAGGMNALKGVENWKVDLTSMDRILEVTGDPSLEPEIIRIVTAAGYQISMID